MTRTRYLSAFLAFISAVAVVKGGPPLAELVERVPDDAGLVAVVPNLEQFVAGVAEFGREAGIEKLAGLTPRCVLSDLHVLETAEGLNYAGPFIFALSPASSAPVVICTATSAETWKQAVRAEALEGALHRVRVLDGVGYAAVQEQIVVLGERDDVVSGALRASGVFARAFAQRGRALAEKHPFVLWARLEPWRPTIESVLLGVEASAQVGMAFSGPQAANSVEFLRWLFGHARQFAGELDSYVMGLRIDKSGVAYQDAATFRTDGQVARYLKHVKKTQAPLLRGLPDEPAMLVCAGEWELAPGEQSLSALMLEGLLLVDRAKERQDDASFQRAIAATRRVYDRTRGYSFLMQPGAKLPGILISGLYFTDDPPALLSDLRCSMELCPEFASVFGPGSSVEVACEVETIGGNEAQVYSIKFTTADEQTRRVLDGLYGAEPRQYAGLHPAGVAYAIGPAGAAETAYQRMLDSRQAGLMESPRVRAALRRVSAEAQVIALLDIPKFFDLAVQMAAEMGAPAPKVESSRGPGDFAVLAGYTEGGDTLRSEIFLPVEPVRVLVRQFREINAADKPR